MGDWGMWKQNGVQDKQEKPFSLTFVALQPWLGPCPPVQPSAPPHTQPCHFTHAGQLTSLTITILITAWTASLPSSSPILWFSAELAVPQPALGSRLWAPAPQSLHDCYDARFQLLCQTGLPEGRSYIRHSGPLVSSGSTMGLRVWDQNQIMSTEVQETWV